MPVEKIEEGSQSVPYNTETGEDVVLQPQPQRPAGANDIYERGYAEGYAKGFEDGQNSKSSDTAKDASVLTLWRVSVTDSPSDTLVAASSVGEAISKYIGRHPDNGNRINGVSKMDSVIY